MCLKEAKIQEKSDELSDKYREEGNKEYRDNAYGEKLMNALWLYNKALCFAQSKKKLALAYANRSTIYFETKKYDESLQNIKWAREHGYPAKKRKKLNDFEDKCIKAQSEEVKNPEEDPMNYFKLSHPPNPKIPFIADCLEYRNGGVYATCDLKAGDIIAMEPIAYGFLHFTAQYSRCCLCFKTVQCNLIPCLKCASLMFCSEECRDKTYEIYNDMNKVVKYDQYLIFNHERALTYGDEAFGSRSRLKLFIRDNNVKLLKKIVFNYDFSGSPDDPEYKRNMLKCMLSMKKFPTHRMMLSHEVTHCSEDKTIAKYLERFSMALDDHATPTGYILIGHGPMVEGCFLYPFMKLIKHDCNYNIGRFQLDTKMMMYATKPVKVGEELSINYIGPFMGAKLSKTAGRQNGLKVYLSTGKCKCSFCTNDIDEDKLNKTDPEEFWSKLEESKVYADPRTCSSYKEIFAELEKLWELISEASDDPLSYRVEKLRVKTEQLMLVAVHRFCYPALPDNMALTF